jgi:hypothetical protein
MEAGIIQPLASTANTSSTVPTSSSQPPVSTSSHQPRALTVPVSRQFSHPLYAILGCESPTKMRLADKEPFRRPPRPRPRPGHHYFVTGIDAHNKANEQSTRPPRSHMQTGPPTQPGQCRPMAGQPHQSNVDSRSANLLHGNAAPRPTKPPEKCRPGAIALLSRRPRRTQAA